MELYEVFSSPFKLTDAWTNITPVPTHRAYFKTDNIFGETTKEEIYILSKMYFDSIIQQYKNYTIEDQQTTESSYRLSVGLLEDGELKYKHIYSCSYNNIQDRISWDNKYDENLDIEGDYFVRIEVTAMVFTDYDSNDEVEDEDQLKRTITESECIICYENKPNMLYLECLHLCVCNICDTKGRFRKCPLCRTKIKNQKIRIT